MHLEIFKTYCDLAQLQSFSKTAEKNLLSQSAVSQQLAQLETAYKCQLINRKKRPIELTREGQLLYRAAKEILERYDQLKSELKTLKSSETSRINVSAIFSIGMHRLSGYVKKFMMKFPEVNVHVEYMDYQQIYDSVLSGDIDIGIVAIPKRDKRLDVYDFVDESLVLACNPKHPFSKETQIDIHKLQFEKMIRFEKEVPSRVWIDGILQRYSVTVHPVMEFDNVETIKRAIEINAGVSILPRAAILQEVASGTIVEVSFSNERFVRPTGIIVRRNKILSPAGIYFIDLLRGQGK